MAIRRGVIEHAFNFRANHSLFQSLQHVSLEILSVFYPTADSDEVIIHACCLPLVFWDTGMCHAARHFYQTLHTSQAFRQGKDVSILTEPFSCLRSPFDAEAQHAAAQTIPVLLQADRMLLVGQEPGVVDEQSMGGCLKSVRDQECILRCFSRP